MSAIMMNLDQHNKKDIAYHDAISSEYDRVVVKPREYAIDALFAPFEKYLSRRRVSMLDMGSGTGHMLCRYAALFERVIALDHSEGMLEVARRTTRALGLTNTEFICADALEFSRRCGTGFDSISCVGFLHHVRSDALQEIFFSVRKLLSDEGVFIVAEPTYCDRAEPRILKWGNSTYVRRAEHYTVPAEDPDEAPLALETLRTACRNADLRIVHERRGWEIFPRSKPAGRLDRCAIRTLHAMTEGDGPVYVGCGTAA